MNLKNINIVTYFCKVNFQTVNLLKINKYILNNLL